MQHNYHPSSLIWSSYTSAVSWDAIRQSQHLVYTPMEEVHCTSVRQGIITCQRPLVCWNKTCHLVFSGNGILNWTFDWIIYSCQNNKHLFWKKKRKEDPREEKWMSKASLLLYSFRFRPVICHSKRDIESVLKWQSDLQSSFVLHPDFL